MSDSNNEKESAGSSPKDLAASMELGKIVLYECDVHTGISRRSHNSVSILGLPDLGPHDAWTDCIDAEDVTYFKNVLHLLTPQSPLYEIEYRIKHAINGSRFWVLDRGAAVFDEEGNRVSVCGAIVDISGHIRAQTAVRDSAKLHSLAAESARMGAWHLDLLSDRMIASEELLALLELKPEQFDGTVTAFEKFIHPDDMHAWQLGRTRALSPDGQVEFEFRVVLRNRNIQWFLTRGNVVRRFDGIPLECYGVMIDITERKDWEKRQTLLLRELSHRVTNTLAVIQSIMRQTLRSKSDPKAFAEAFEGRISSLAASHGMLTNSEWRGGNLADIIRNQLDGMVDDIEQRFMLKGPTVVLPAEPATQLGLVLHELATNAAKYGALSTDNGKITIRWTVSGDRLRLLWLERGGPRIDKSPGQLGFGTALINASVKKVMRRYDPAGLTCRLELAL